jgi:hypothetical protein
MPAVHAHGYPPTFRAANQLPYIYRNTAWYCPAIITLTFARPWTIRIHGFDFRRTMNRISKFPAAGVSPRSALVLDPGQITWEYRFSDVNESPSTAQGNTAEGWIVVSSSTRRDQRREYLLKRPRR